MEWRSCSDTPNLTYIHPNNVLKEGGKAGPGKSVKRPMVIMGKATYFSFSLAPCPNSHTQIPEELDEKIYNIYLFTTQQQLSRQKCGRYTAGIGMMTHPAARNRDAENTECVYAIELSFSLLHLSTDGQIHGSRKNNDGRVKFPFFNIPLFHLSLGFFFMATYLEYSYSRWCVSLVIHCHCKITINCWRLRTSY